MKQADKNEVDLLLRSLARRSRGQLEARIASAPEDGNQTISDHLDADELNSYAEGVVPGAARARYTEHLADCPKCRRIMIGLTQAVGATARYSEQQNPAGVWQKLVALFSPTVLRYAVPALVLTAVIAISLLALRQQRRPEFVAQNQPTDSQVAANGPAQTESPIGQLTTRTQSTNQRGTESPAAAVPKEQQTFQDEKSTAAQKPGTSTGADLRAAASTKESPQSGQVAGVAEPQPSFAPEPRTVAAAPPPHPTVNEDKMGVLRKESAPREAEERRRENYKDQSRDEGVSGPNRSRNQPSSSSGRKVETLSSIAQNRADDAGRNKSESDMARKKTDSDVETRQVSGRRFRRQGNAWVDTAYEPSRATVNVARGSEQYRALVADEPGIRTIAQQLGGEVIIVWKGKAYRIH